MTDHTKQTTLDARLVIGRLWSGAVVHLTERVRHASRWNERAVAFGPGKRPGSWLVTCERPNALHGGILEPRTFDPSGLLLLLPGEDGGNLYRLRQRVRERMAEWTNTTECTMPDWFYAALGRASVEHEGNPWLSTYLVCTDALAAKLGWPTGPGAPVYGWKQGDRPGRWLLSGGQYASRPGTKNPTEYSADESITDPMAALEAVWRRECAR